MPETVNPEIDDIEISRVLNSILDHFSPSDDITDDSLTTAELAEMVRDHLGFVVGNQIYKAMIDAGYHYKFSFSRREVVWMMELL